MGIWIGIGGTAMVLAVGALATDGAHLRDRFTATPRALAIGLDRPCLRWPHRAWRPLQTRAADRSGGRALAELGRLPDALACFERAVELARRIKPGIEDDLARQG